MTNITAWHQALESNLEHHAATYVATAQAIFQRPETGNSEYFASEQLTGLLLAQGFTFVAAQAFVADVHQRAQRFGRQHNLPLIMNSFHAIIGESEADVARRLREKHERIDYEQGRLRVADMLGGELDLREHPLDQPLPAALIPHVTQVQRRQGRAAIFRQYALEGLTLRELIIKAEETGHWFAAGTPSALADAIEQRYQAGVLDVISLHGLGQPDQQDLLLNGLLPELRRRQLLDTDYQGPDFRSSLELPPLRQVAQ